MPATWDALPLTWPLPGTRQRALCDLWILNAGDTTPGRLPFRGARIGDSRSTTPGGAGRFINGPFNAMWAQRYSNMPSTGILTGATFGRLQGGTPLIITSAPDGTAGTITASYVPPNITTRAYLSSNNGCACVMSDGWLWANHLVSNYGGGRYVDRATASMYPEIVGYNTASSSTLNWKLKSTSSSTVNFFTGTQLTTGATAALTGDGTTCTRTLFPSSRQAYPDAGNAINAAKYMQLEVTGGHASNTTVFAAAFLHNYTNPAGIVWDDFGASGLKASEWTSTYANSGAYFKARPYDVYVIQLGANDSAGSVSASTFKTDMAALIAQIRAADPGKTIYLVGDYYRGGLTGGQLTELDKYPGVLYELAQATDKCVFINLRRWLETAGWNSTFQVSVAAATAWATSTGYVAGNIVSTPSRGVNLDYWRCLTNHTSAATDQPGRETDGGQGYWEPVTNWLTSDLVHTSTAGGVLMSQGLYDLMTMGVGYAYPTGRNLRSRS